MKLHFSQIAITVVVIVLAVVIVVGIVTFCLVRKRRNAELVPTL
jgi:hypothetical protein